MGELFAAFEKSIAADSKDTAGTQESLPEASVVTGDSVCTGCHYKELRSWRGSRHASAFASLARRRAQERSECNTLPCRSFRVERRNGRSREHDSFGKCQLPELPSRYLETHNQWKRTADFPTSQICIRCHSQEIQPTFSFARSVSLISHKASPGSEYVVQKGDNLSRIAFHVFSNSLYWKKLYRANTERVSNPNLIFPQQRLVLPRNQ